MESISRRHFGKLAAASAASAVAAVALAGCASPKTQPAASSTQPAAQPAAAPAGVPVAAKVADAKRVVGTVTTTVNLSSYPAGQAARVWLPIARDFDYQAIDTIQFSAPSAKVAEVNQDAEGNKMLYVEWAADADPASRTVEMSFHANRVERQRPNIVDDGKALPSSLDAFLTGSKLVPINDQVVEAAKEIVGDRQSGLEKAYAIYQWIIENMNRDEGVEGCGQGDVCALLSTKSGKCTDINSVFVGLCRAVGVPAREQFGVRMNADKITGNQHCWCEFYVSGTGWVSADAADVLKAVLKGGWTKDAPETKEKADFFWGSLDAQRVQLSFGRDVTLAPAHTGEPLNYFGYPYGEVDGSALDYYDPENFSYAMTFKADEA
ncbi:transglutaminase domain-containing protein [Eggerthellaceae bacterium zg-997]|nr:transglutaminase domain-containing protein [Eggerthellaceae bacterium zg-997]